MEANIPKDVLSFGLSAFFLQATNFVRQTLIFKSMSHYGTDSDLAFFGAVFRIFVFSVTPVFGLLQVLQPVVGINYGAGNFERCVKAIQIFRTGGILFLLAIWIPLMLFSSTIVSVMLPGKILSIEELLQFRTIIMLMPLFPISISGIIFFKPLAKEK